MPFIILVGLPASGKTTVANKLVEFFTAKEQTVTVISETDILKQKNASRNSSYVDSRFEKEIRGTLKSEVLRKMGPDSILILDGLNYIKGFRYELYCASKSIKTTSCTVHCEPGSVKAWEYNLKRDPTEQYSQEIFDGLVQRYEEPDSRNRWDSPMVTVLDSEKIAFEEIECALFNRKPPPPNQSTQCPPLSDTNFLHEVDKAAQLIISDITSALKMGCEGEVSVSGTKEKVVVSGERNVSIPQLMRLKRQYITYVKAHPNLKVESIATCFVQYLNTNINQ